PIDPVRISTPPLDCTDPPDQIPAANSGPVDTGATPSGPILETNEPVTRQNAPATGQMAQPPMPSRPGSVQSPHTRVAARPVQSVPKARTSHLSAKAAVAASEPVKASSSPNTLFGVQLDEAADLIVDKPARTRYWIAAVVAFVVLSGSAGAYLLVRRNQARNR